MWAANVHRILYMVKVNILSALFFFIIQGCSVRQEISRLYFPNQFYSFMHHHHYQVRSPVSCFLWIHLGLKKERNKELVKNDVRLAFLPPKKFVIVFFLAFFNLQSATKLLTHWFFQPLLLQFIFRPCYVNLFAPSPPKNVVSPWTFSYIQAILNEGGGGGSFNDLVCGRNRSVTLHIKTTLQTWCANWFWRWLSVDLYLN